MNRRILHLAIPNIVSNITIPLLGLIDLALMGHLNSELYIGAIALGGVIFNLLYWGFSFLRMSTSGFTAQSFGENKLKEAATILFRAGIVASIAGIFMVALQGPITWIGFNLISGSDEVKLLAEEYFKIRIWAAPAALTLFVFNGWFLGMQNARYPMIMAVLVNLVNIGLSVFFVFVLDMKSEGVALGTALSQYFGLLIALLLFFKKYKNFFHFVSKQNLFDIQFLKRFFRVNSDIFIRTFCIIAVHTFFTSKSAGMSDTILAVNSLLLQFLLFFSFFIDGFAYAGEALVGRYVGARSLPDLKQVVRYLFNWGAVLALFFTILYIPGIRWTLHLLTSQHEVIESALPFLPWIIAVPLVSFASFVWDGIYIGATASKAMRDTMLLATFVIFIPVVYFLHPKMGNHALWMGMLLFMLARGILQTIWFKTAIIKPLTD